MLRRAAVRASGARFGAFRHPHGDALVALRWETKHGSSSSVMGLAPLGEMPVARRAPFVAFTAWPGRPRNPRWTSKPGQVGFPDIVLQEQHLADAA